MHSRDARFPTAPVFAVCESVMYVFRTIRLSTPCGVTLMLL